MRVHQVSNIILLHKVHHDARDVCTNYFELLCVKTHFEIIRSWQNELSIIAAIDVLRSHMGVKLWDNRIYLVDARVLKGRRWKREFEPEDETTEREMERVGACRSRAYCHW